MNQFSKTIRFDKASSAAAFVEENGLPYAAVSPEGFKWVNGSRKATGYVVRMPV